MGAVPTNGVLVLCNQTLRGRVVENPIAGSVEPIDALAKFAADVETDAMWFADDAGVARNRLAELSSCGVAAIRNKLNERVIPGGTTLQISASAMKRALNRYASSVDSVHRGARKCVTRVDALLASIRMCSETIADIAQSIHALGAYAWDSGPPAEMPTPELSARLIGLDEGEHARQLEYFSTVLGGQWAAAAQEWQALLRLVVEQQETWERLYDERVEAEERLISGLTGTAVGHLVSIGGGSISGQRVAISHGIAGELWGNSPPSAPQVRKSHALLRTLIGSTTGEHVWDDPPHPEIVAANWGALTPAEQQRLIAEVPWVIGNLPGLPFAVRDAANRAMIAIYQQHPQTLTPDQLKLLAEISDILNLELDQIATLGEARPPIQIGALELATAVPKTMVAYGNVDAATHTTVQVPGMNSDAPGALESWDRASRNVHYAQNAIRGFTGQSSVVAWLGYDTPEIPLSGDWGVLGSSAAETGAERLAHELDGIRAAHDGTSVLNVLGHSYGTTVATIALTLTKNDVDTLIMLGSAGLDTVLVPTLDVLNVKELSPGQQAIYTTHADADRLAPLGAGAAGRGLPNPDARAPLGIHNFSAVYDGALMFSSEGDPTQDLKRTDGHSAIGAGLEAGFIGSTASKGAGYLDPKTQSLDSIAQLTTGRENDRLRQSLVRTQPAHVESIVTSTGQVLPQRRTEGVNN